MKGVKASMIVAITYNLYLDFHLHWSSNVQWRNLLLLTP